MTTLRLRMLGDSIGQLGESIPAIYSRVDRRSGKRVDVYIVDEYDGNSFVRVVSRHRTLAEARAALSKVRS